MPRKTEEAEMDAHYAHIVRAFQYTTSQDTGPYVLGATSASSPHDKSYMLRVPQHVPQHVRVHDGTTRTVNMSSIAPFDARPVLIPKINKISKPVHVHLAVMARKRLSRATTKAMAGVEILIGGCETTALLLIGFPYTFLYFSPRKVLPKRNHRLEAK